VSVTNKKQDHICYLDVIINGDAEYKKHCVYPDPAKLLVIATNAAAMRKSVLASGRALPSAVEDVAAGSGGGVGAYPGRAVPPALKSGRVVASDGTVRITVSR
jgi:hypothetical protein